MKSLRATGWVLSLALVGISLCSAAPAFATTYYVAANGSDSNNGTSKSTPFLHAPYMATCTATCATITLGPGDSLIFKGGDTWHFGNSAAVPYTGGGWTEQGGGASGNYLYIGVDKTWYSGTSWTRPVFTGDNPTSTTPVSACTYDESTMVMLQFNSTANYIQLDNIEFTGQCWHGNQSNSNEHICCSTYINWFRDTATPSYMILSNLYMHGWTHVTFSCSLSGGHPTGNCDGHAAISGTSQSTFGEGDKIIGLVCDGSDSDPASGSCIAWDCYDVEDSILRDASEGAVCNNAHIWHDDIIEDIHESADGIAHSNGFKFNNEWAASNYFYNIIERNNTSAVGAWLCSNTAPDYLWNLVIYGNISEPLNLVSCGSSFYVYNTTFADETGLGGTSANYANTLVINSTFGSTPASSINEIDMTDAQATKAGITASSAFPYQLTSSNCNGVTPCPVNTGANLTSSWPTGFSTDDTTFACTYVTSNHTMSCPARTPVGRPSAKTTSTGQPAPWDVGAFELGAPISSLPAPPSNLVAVAN